MIFRFPYKCPECELEGYGRDADYFTEEGKHITTKVCVNCDCEMVKK